MRAPTEGSETGDEKVFPPARPGFDNLLRLLFRFSGSVRREEFNDYTIASGENVLVPIREDLRQWRGRHA